METEEIVEHEIGVLGNELVESRAAIREFLNLLNVSDTVVSIPARRLKEWCRAVEKLEKVVNDLS